MLFELTDQPIDTQQIINKVVRSEAGAVTTFIGIVREWTDDKQTVYLEYEAYPAMAVKQLARIGDEIAGKWPNSLVAITHRVGSLHISDVAVVIAVSSPHRKEAYEANEYAIERIKQIVPIWKKEMWQDGSAWIGDQREQHAYPSGSPCMEVLE
jgi:molybdopterin synthase catalytic subunit